MNITDGNSCSYEETFNVIEPEEIDFEFEVQNVSCFQEADGNVHIEMIGGTPPFTYNFNGAEIGPTLSEIFIRDNLGPGSYPFTVTDDNQCSFDTVFSITQFEIQTDITPASAFGEADGLLVLNVINGLPPYSAIINGNEFTEFPVSFTLTGGNGLNILATDDSGCEISFNEFSPYLGINDLEIEKIDVFPNPSSGVIQLPVLNCDEDWQLGLYDGTGRLIQSWNSNKEEINVGTLSKGVYLLDIMCSNKRFQAKVVRL